MSSRACRSVQLADYRQSLQRHHFGLVGAGPFRSSICHDIGAQRILGEPRGRLCGAQRLPPRLKNDGHVVGVRPAGALADALASPAGDSLVGSEIVAVGR